jgi:hypothetical protein
MIVSVFIALLSSGCATHYNQASSHFPPLPAGEGRIFFYRSDAFNGIGALHRINLNGHGLRYLDDGAFFYVDRPPGNYAVSFDFSIWGPTETKLTFTLAPDETKYVRIGMQSGHFAPIPVPALEDKDAAMNTLPRCIYAAYK